MSTVAIVCCVHHKPWLMMSTLITALAQDFHEADFHFIYNVGAGDRRYGDASTRNSQLSPFDPRVRDVCRIRGRRVFEVEYENDEALDSGAWYKFIRDGRWRAYDWVLFVGEGTLFARPRLLSAMLALGEREGAHLVASGHEKRRLPKDVFLNYLQRTASSADDRLHDAMIAQAFDIFCRDPEFRRIFERWGNDFLPETQNHVPPAGPPSPLLRRVREAWARRIGAAQDGGLARELPFTIEYALTRAGMAPSNDRSDTVYVDGRRVAATAVAPVTRIHDVGFHREAAPEWFGCATNHLMSRTFLERFSAKLDEFGMWDVLDLRFAGTPLEVIWGFIPAWLGFDKWFTDGFHRPRKDFVTYRREDYPPQMATYINRYYSGVLATAWDGDYIKLRHVHTDLARLKSELPPVYF